MDHIFIFISVLIICLYRKVLSDCPPTGYSLSSSSDIECETLDTQCTPGIEDKWVITGCGCGCKLACVELGSTWHGTTGYCQAVPLTCPDDTEYWETAGCGCGCSSPDTSISPASMFVFVFVLTHFDVAVIIDLFEIKLKRVNRRILSYWMLEMERVMIMDHILDLLILI